MIELNKVEQDLLEVILQKAINNSDYKNYGPVIKNIYYKIELGLFLHEYSKNKFDCDGFDLLPENTKMWIRNEVLNEIDNILNLN